MICIASSAESKSTMTRASAPPVGQVSAFLEKQMHRISRFVDSRVRRWRGAKPPEAAGGDLPLISSLVSWRWLLRSCRFLEWHPFFGVSVRGLDLATLFMQSRLLVSLLESAKLSSDGLVVPATVISCGYCLLWLVGVVACISFIASTCVSADGSTSAVVSCVANVTLALYPLFLCAAIDFAFGDTMTRLGLSALSGAVLAAPTAACFVQLVVAAAQLVLVLAPECYRPASSN